MAVMPLLPCRTDTARLRLSVTSLSGVSIVVILTPRGHFPCFSLSSFPFAFAFFFSLCFYLGVVAGFCTIPPIRTHL